MSDPLFDALTDTSASKLNLYDEITRLRAALAAAERERDELRTVVSLSSSDAWNQCLATKSRAERAEADLAAARGVMTAVRSDLGPIHFCDVVFDRCAICTVVLRVDAFLERTAAAAPQNAK